MYTINKIKDTVIITMLNYMDAPSNVVKAAGVGVVIDTCLASGDNSYRFIKKTKNDYEYIKPSDDFIKEANKILANYPEYVKNSILPKTQQDKILKKTSSEKIQNLLENEDFIKSFICPEHVKSGFKELLFALEQGLIESSAIEKYLEDTNSTIIFCQAIGECMYLDIDELFLVKLNDKK